MKRCMILCMLFILLFPGCDSGSIPGEDTLPETAAGAITDADIASGETTAMQIPQEAERTHCEVAEPVSFADLLTEIDPDSIVSIRIYSGGLGTAVTVEDADEIEAILAAAEPLTGTDPISSQGFYGLHFSVEIFYRENDIPKEFSFEIWSNGPKPQKDAAVILRMADGNAFFAETLSDGQTVRIDSPMYTVDADTLAVLDELCREYFSKT